MTRKYKEFNKQKVSKAKQIIQVALEKVSKSKVDDLISVLAEKSITFGLATSQYYYIDDVIYRAKITPKTKQHHESIMKSCILEVLL
jgi:hypothetical protein